MLVKIDIPTLAPNVILSIRGLMREAEVQFAAGAGTAKKNWVKSKGMHLLKDVPLPKIPPWLDKPIKAAVLSVIIDTIWTLDYRPEA
jgi:hypothetical protein